MPDTYTILAIDSDSPPTWMHLCTTAEPQQGSRLLNGETITDCRWTVTTYEYEELEAALDDDDTVLSYSYVKTEREEQLDALAARAVNDVTRAIMRDGIDLSHDEADDLGEETLAWMRSRLGLTITETSEGVECTSEVRS